MSLNAGEIASGSITFAWGVSPGSAQVTVPGEDSEFAVGDDTTVTIGGLTFYGRVTAVPVLTQNGKQTTYHLVDNRIRLQDATVFCVLNQQEIRDDNPSTPGIDRWRLFWHILPEDWATQKKTYTAVPYTAAEVVDILLDADTVALDWTTSNHASMSTTPVYNLNANEGKKLGALLGEVAEQTGLVFTLSGESTLLWARKGEGVVPVPPPTQKAQGTDGEAISNNDTKVRVVGQRNIYQTLSLDLEPDWLSGYEAFWLETDWLDEVESVFGPYDADEAGYAARAEKARLVTVREYAVAKASAAYADRRRWGEVSRMEMPVWLYLREIVFKVYRVPYSFELNEIPAVHLELHEGLLAAVDYDPDTGVLSYKTPREYYPEDRLFVIVKGAQVDGIDLRNQKALTDAQLDHMRDVWWPNHQFSIDRLNKTIVFEEAQFVPGEGAAGLFVFPNRSADGIEEGHPLYNLAVPNADVTVTAASVRVSVAFEAEKFFKDYGSGDRFGAYPVPALNYHRLQTAGVTTEEVNYDEGQTTDDLADEYADSLILQQATYQTGGWERVGAAGTALNGTVDRITVTIDFGGGLKESIEYSKERMGATFLNERMVERMARSRELFPGQKQNEQEAWGIRALGYLRSRPSARSKHEANYASAQDVMQRPLGGAHCNPQMVVGVSSAKAAGTPLFCDEGTGEVDAEGKVFCGIVVADGASGTVACATSGVVPVRVQGPFAVGDAVGVNGAESYCRAGSAFDAAARQAVGVVNAAYEGDGIVVAPVRIGAGGVTRRTKFETFQISSTVVGIEPGTVNDEEPTTVDGYESASWQFEIASDGTKWIYLQADLDADGLVEASYLKIGSSVPAQPDGNPATGTPPASTYRPVAQVVKSGSVLTITNYLTRSQWVTVGVSNFGCSFLQRNVTWGE